MPSLTDLPVGQHDKVPVCYECGDDYRDEEAQRKVRSFSLDATVGGVGSFDISMALSPPVGCGHVVS